MEFYSSLIVHYKSIFDLLQVVFNRVSGTKCSHHASAIPSKCSASAEEESAVRFLKGAHYYYELKSVGGVLIAHTISLLSSFQELSHIPKHALTTTHTSIRTHTPNPHKHTYTPNATLYG